MKKRSFYDWVTMQAVDGIVNLLRLISERMGQGSLLARLKTKFDTITWQHAFWTLFVVVFLHVYMLLFMQKLVLILALDIAVAGLLIVFGPDRLWTMLRTSVLGRLLTQLFDPNK